MNFKTNRMRHILLAGLMMTGIGHMMSAGTEEARLLRFPTINGNLIVFSYGGDLYSVPAGGGEARRLTSHVGYEIFPPHFTGRERDRLYRTV